MLFLMFLGMNIENDFGFFYSFSSNAFSYFKDAEISNRTKCHENN